MVGVLRKEVGEKLGKVYRMEEVTIGKGCNDAKTCAHVCIDTAEGEYIKNYR